MSPFVEAVLLALIVGLVLALPQLAKSSTSEIKLILCGAALVLCIAYPFIKYSWKVPGTSMSVACGSIAQPIPSPKYPANYYLLDDADPCGSERRDGIEFVSIVGGLVLVVGISHWRAINHQASSGE